MHGFQLDLHHGILDEFRYGGCAFERDIYLSAASAENHKQQYECDRSDNGANELPSVIRIVARVKVSAAYFTLVCNPVPCPDVRVVFVMFVGHGVK